MEANELYHARDGKKTVALVGYAERTRIYAPWDDERVECWTLNKAHLEPWCKRITRHFQIHGIGYLRRCTAQSQGDRDHFEWLSQPHDFPLYIQAKYPEFPSGIPFPIHEARRRFGNFYTSTMAYMMAIAIMEGFERIEIYGFEMESDTEYRYQRDSAEYFIGMAVGLGIEVYLPSNCKLLKGKTYAFETSEIGLRQQLEFRRTNVANQMNIEGSEHNKAKGFLSALQELVPDYPDLATKAADAEKNLEIKKAILQTVNGARQEAAEAVKMFDEYHLGEGNNVNGQTKITA